MSSPFPLRPSIDHAPRSRVEIDLGDEETTAVLGALGSETARSILHAVADGPAPASELADEVDSSLQNVHYHLTKLRDAGLVTEAGTWYSAKGNEMDVYDLTSERVAVRLSSESDDAATVDREQRDRPRTESTAVR
ncbi:MAG: ArsR/SmtB family transcription factor [Haloferacaceae archaeon]